MILLPEKAKSHIPSDAQEGVGKSPLQCSHCNKDWVVKSLAEGEGEVDEEQDVLIVLKYFFVHCGKMLKIDKFG